MKTTALIYSRGEETFPGNGYFGLSEILKYLFYRYFYYFIYRVNLLLDFAFKPTNKRTRVAIKKELPWVNYCIANMDKTIESISSFNRASHYKNMEYLNLYQVVSNIVRQRKRLATMIGVEVEVNVKKDIFLYLNKELLDIVIRNILDNAIQYSDDKKRKKIVHIGIVENWEQLFISIKDNGIGIPDEELGKIFRMFYQVAPTSPGIGAGLFLAKKAIEKIKGSIDVVSSKGLGSEFLIQIPSAISVLQDMGSSPKSRQ